MKIREPVSPTRVAMRIFRHSATEADLQNGSVRASADDQCLCGWVLGNDFPKLAPQLYIFFLVYMTDATHGMELLQVAKTPWPYLRRMELLAHFL